MKKICRICLEEDDNVISPCNCKGTSQYVHESCLSQWRKNQRRFRCEVCHSQYNLKRNILYTVGIRILCFAAVLVYSFTILLSLRFVLWFFGLTPQVSRSEHYGVLLVGSDWIKWIYKCLGTTGPGLLLVAPSVQAKRHRVSRWSFRYFFCWIFSHRLAFCSPFIAYFSDVIYISLTFAGLVRILYDSWFTSALLSPTVNLIWMDLNTDLN